MKYVELVKPKCGIGDVLMMTPLPRLFATQGYKVLVDTHLPELFETNPYVVKEPFINLEGDDTSRTIQLGGAYELRPRMHYWDALCEAAGLLPCEKERPEIFLTNEELGAMQRMVASTPRPLVIVSPVTGMLWGGKQLPLFTWHKIVHDLTAMGMTVVALGPWLHGHVYKNFIARSIRSLAAFIAQADYFIGHESGPLLLAQAARIPGLCILGSTDSRRFSLIGDEIRPFWNKRLECIGCRHRQAPPTDEEICERGDLACMHGIASDEVVEEFKKCLR